MVCNGRKRNHAHCFSYSQNKQQQSWEEQQLHGRLIFTKQLEPVNPINDPPVDMAIFRKKGCLLDCEQRLKKEHEKAAAKVEVLGGTTLENPTEVKEEPKVDGNLLT
ncbi:hypothetical protein O181_124247 [Austropuccinia psidii MF-1]|uniref:Uncharacterized protein n=1 Tax=Austropuccinia psidii MF-1 TaxID=1389203 RepID=A0A9Q3KPA4_9BASI|nr:hypothetical protein [Austropuccinia psidii MF-1]